jgi:hypothetical protein
MFNSVSRTFLFLARTPLIPPSAAAYGMESRRWASDHGKKELYSDEGGSTGAGVSDADHA